MDAAGWNQPGIGKAVGSLACYEDGDVELCFSFSFNLFFLFLSLGYPLFVHLEVGSKIGVVPLITPRDQVATSSRGFYKGCPFVLLLFWHTGTSMDYLNKI